MENWCLSLDKLLESPGSQVNSGRCFLSVKGLGHLLACICRPCVLVKTILSQPPLSGLSQQCAYPQWQQMGSRFHFPVCASTEGFHSHFLNWEIFLREIIARWYCGLWFWFPCLLPTAVATFNYNNYYFSFTTHFLQMTILVFSMFILEGPRVAH